MKDFSAELRRWEFIYEYTFPMGLSIPTDCNIREFLRHLFFLLSCRGELFKFVIILRLVCYIQYSVSYMP